MDIGKKLRELRTSKKITTKDLATNLNLNVTTYRNYEAGIRQPKLRKLTKLATYHNVSVDYLLCRTDNPKPLEAMESVMYNLPQALARLREAEKASREDIAAIAGVKLWSYSSYEQGKQEPKYDALIALADHYGVSVDELMGRGLEAPEPSVAIEPVEPVLPTLEPLAPFHEILADCMKEAGVNPKQMTRYLGIAPDAFAQYLSGRKEPNHWILARLGDFFGVSADYLIGRTPERGFRDPRRKIRKKQ